MTSTGTSTFTSTSTPPFVYSTSWGSFGSGNGQFKVPTNLYFDTAVNELYVSDCSNNRVLAFDPNGNQVDSIGSAGTGNGQFSCPAGIVTNLSPSCSLCIISYHYLYTVDSSNNRVEEMSQSGVVTFAPGGWTYDLQWGNSSQFAGPAGICSDGVSYIYVADWGNNRIEKFDLSGNLQTQWAGSGGYTLSAPNDAAYDSLHNNVIVADSGNNRIVAFNTSGSPLRKWGHNGGDGTSGSGNGDFNAPSGLDVDASGNVFVADTSNNRIQRFDYAGNFISKSGSLGSGPNNLNTPLDVAVDGVGAVYIADKGNARIVKLLQQ